MAGLQPHSPRAHKLSAMIQFRALPKMHQRRRGVGRRQGGVSPPPGLPPGFGPAPVDQDGSARRFAKHLLDRQGRRR